MLDSGCLILEKSLIADFADFKTKIRREKVSKSVKKSQKVSRNERKNKKTRNC